MQVLQLLSSHRAFEGSQERYRHFSTSLNCEMNFSIYLPPRRENQLPATIYWLSGLTCTDENFTNKAGAQRVAAELGMVLVMPDTSPRGEGVADVENAYDLGLGAGFYVNAIQEPWSRHYHMYDYIVEELPALIEQSFPVSDRRSISGHSMGGHGASSLRCVTRAVIARSPPFPYLQSDRCPMGQKSIQPLSWQRRQKLARL